MNGHDSIYWDEAKNRCVGPVNLGGSTSGMRVRKVTSRTKTEWASRAGDWLRCAAEDDASRRLLLDVLIEGGRPVITVLPQLYGLAHRVPFRDVIADLVLNQISAAQGVELP